jgi:hypothetical protein
MGQLRLVAFPHQREPWNGNLAVEVCVRLGFLKGRDLTAGRHQRTSDYQLAKEQGDYDAAQRLVQACCAAAPGTVERIVDAVISHIERGTRVICIVPHPPFDDDAADGSDLIGKKRVRNALPLQYAHHLAALLGAEVEMNIVQKARVGRTKLSKFLRFLCQPGFEGAVDPGAVYVLVDDVFTMGGTLAALRSHIVRNEGTVACTTTLAHVTGRSQTLALQRQTWDELVKEFGAELDGFWTTEIGHGAQCLTEAEGQSLVQWAREQSSSGSRLLQRLRDRLTEAAATGK